MRKGWVKVIVAVLCVLLLNVGVWGCVAFGAWEYKYGNHESFYDSPLFWTEAEADLDMVEEGLGLFLLAETTELPGYYSQRFKDIQEEFETENSNFRFAVYEKQSGKLLFHNAGNSDDWKTEVHDVLQSSFDRWSSDSGRVWYRIDWGVIYPLAADDEYRASEMLYYRIDQMAPFVLVVSIACIVVSLILLILLMRAAGRRPGREEVVPNWHDKIPYDLYLAVQIVLNGLCWGLSLVESIWYLDAYPNAVNAAWVAASGLAGSTLVIAFLLTTATRIKARTLFRNTIIWRLCSLLWRGCKAVVRGIRKAINALPLVWRIVVLFAIYLVGALLTTILFAVGVVWFDYDGWAVFLTLLMIVAIPAWHGFALYLLCRWAMQWKQMRATTQEIIAGKTNAKIEHEKFYPDLKEHALQLNDLGRAIDGAVEERMKSERFKSELITNVSHDLKTPLTSIINYVDLLKKEEIENPTAREYIEVLDRKSQRLKKLTEDLVEASKASTGALTVSKDDLDLVQLIRQAVGEYEEKLSAAGLTLMTGLPEGALHILADGRHVWRVLDNLLNNCVKYAMEGTRVYLDAAVRNGNAVVTVKNISRNPLNVPAEQLVERFVRGDESRTTEGSGLGLSIARSLTELQGGQFALDIDGDLFKAKVTFPLKEE